ncbi:hypothetical protein VP249E411_P0156 [Vibrio phage 249E41-1]|nr:hypothetical protein VP249E411_P0156 [Vibrio phage 249E41-1]
MNKLHIKTLNVKSGILKCTHFDLNIVLEKKAGCQDWHITSCDEGITKHYGLKRATKAEAWTVAADMFGAVLIVGNSK